MRLLYALCVVTCFLLIGCRTSPKSDEPIGELKTAILDSLFRRDSSAYRLVLVFDGNCPSCFAELSYVYQGLKKDKKNFPYPVYSAFLSADTISYAVTIRRFGYLMIGEVLQDTGFYMIKQNLPYVRKGVMMFLIDRENRLMIVGNPFIHKDVMNQYRRLRRNNKQTK